MKRVLAILLLAAALADGDINAGAQKAAKKDKRSGGQAEVMKAFVSGLSDGDIADLSAYYGSLKP